MSRLNQTHLITQFNRYIFMTQMRHSIGHTDVLQLKVGLCLGFSITKSYMDSIGKNQWWFDVRTLISVWKGDFEQLKKKYKLKQSNHLNGETGESIFERAISYILYNQGSTQIHPNAQITLDDKSFEARIVKNFDPVHGSIKHYVSIAGHLNETQLQYLLDERLFSLPGIKLSLSIRHACSIRYDIDDQRWYFSDPNHPDDEIIVATKGTLASTIFNVLGHDIGLLFATWLDDPETKAAIQEWRNKHAQILQENPTELLSNHGLHAIALVSPKLLPKFFLLSQKDAMLHQNLFIGLESKVSIPAGREYTGRDMIRYFSPEGIRKCLQSSIERLDDQYKTHQLKISCHNRYEQYYFSTLIPFTFEEIQKKAARLTKHAPNTFEIWADNEDPFDIINVDEWNATLKDLSENGPLLLRIQGKTINVSLSYHHQKNIPLTINSLDSYSILQKKIAEKIGTPVHSFGLLLDDVVDDIEVNNNETFASLLADLSQGELLKLNVIIRKIIVKVSYAGRIYQPITVEGTVLLNQLKRKFAQLLKQHSNSNMEIYLKNEKDMQITTQDDLDAVLEFLPPAEALELNIKISNPQVSYSHVGLFAQKNKSNRQATQIYEIPLNSR